jgi:hypothetical protein
MITSLNIAWAAGFLEGEGSFMQSRTTPYLECCQVQLEPLQRLQAMFGGTISFYERKSNNPKWSDYHRWTLYGNKAAGVMMTLYTLMSPKRQDKIEVVIKDWVARGIRGAHHRNMTHCKSGHEYVDGSWTRKGENGRQCNSV